MNYIYFHSGELPNYLKYSIDSIIKNDPESKIYIICDDIFKYKNIKSIQIKNLNNSLINEIKSLNYYTNWNSNPLWESSLLRIFYLYEAAKTEYIDQFVHFDSDVILFEPFSEIKSLFNENFNITPLTNNFLVFGYSFIGSLDVYRKICEAVLNVYRNNQYYENKYYEGKKIIEMKALYIAYKENPELFNLLPVHPEDSNKYVFDPASYGQYIAGVHNKKFSRGFTDASHLLGKDLKDKVLSLSIKKNSKIVKFKNFDYKLINLHVHSKKLKKYFNF